MRTLIQFSKGLSGILLLSLLILYGGQDIQAESSEEILLASTADWLSVEWGASRSIAWGDVDGDGDLDLAVANADTFNRVYLNTDGVLDTVAYWSSRTEEASYSIAWGDVDGDGDLDLAVGNAPNEYLEGEGKNQIYINKDGQLAKSATWFSKESEATYSLAWGDVDNDGDLDLVAGNQGANHLYLNNLDRAGVNPNQDHVSLGTSAAWSSIETEKTHSVVWGDLDNDGDLDLAAGNIGASNHIYLNVKGQLQSQAHWLSEEKDDTQSLAWADANNDGYLDLAAGNNGANRLYTNQNGRLPKFASWSTEEEMNTHAISWGDLDGDGDLDLAIANGSRTKSGSSSIRQPNQLYLNNAGELGTTSWTSDEEDDSYSLAWGDVDGDDDLDLAIGSGGVRRIYYNKGNVLQPTPAWSDDQTTPSLSVAWGDMDGDGDLDLAVGNRKKPDQVYLNQNGTLESIGWVAEMSSDTTSIAWGDIDGDHDLDLAVGNRDGPNYVYENLGTTLDVTPFWASDEVDNTASVAWGDMDGDGDLDLAVGNGSTGSTRVPNRVYINNIKDGTMLESSASWSSKPAQDEDGGGREDVTNDIAWGDLDGDGDLDLAAGNNGFNRIYRNENNILQQVPFWSSTKEDRTSSVAWGDVDNDGDLDLAVGNEQEPNRIYLNEGEQLQFTAYWSSFEEDMTKMLGWGDVNGDGNLDLAVGNYGEPSRVYINLDGQLQDSVVWNSGETDRTNAIAWGDVDNDGDLDLAVGNEGINRIYVGKARHYPQLGSAYIHIEMQSDAQNLQSTEVGASADTTFLTTPADFYATTRVWRTSKIPIAYTLFDPSEQPARFVKGFYSLDGGGNWLPAHPITDVQDSTIQSPIQVYNTYQGEYIGIKGDRLDPFDVQPASATKTLQNHRFMLPLVMKNGAPTTLIPEPVTGTFLWDTLANDSVGQSDNVVFRLEAHLSGANTFQRATVGAQTYPFRVRSLLQPRVQTETGIDAANALVYRLPKGQTQGAMPFATKSGTPYRTDQYGYLQGRGQLVAGDQLMAMLPVDQKPIYGGNIEPYRVYETSAEPTTSGVQFQTVELGTDQIIKVSSANPLILFDLVVSLEWDARSDKAFQEQLMSDLKRTARILYDWTNGQATLGNIKVYQNREEWNAAHIRIYASSTLRPNADIGGIVSMLITDTVTLNKPNPTVEPSPFTTPIPSEPILSQASINAHPAASSDKMTTEIITYGPGQVRMGANWNRFGDSSGSTLSEDWPRTLAHELGHYLFFLDDNYLGVDNTGLLIPITSCPGAMSDPYQGEESLGFDEFHPNDVAWKNHCAQTFSNIRTGRSDWATIANFYPWFNTEENSGPSTLPLEVTQVTFKTPEIVQAAQNNMPLESPIFFVTESRDGKSYEPSPQARAILFQEASDWLIDLGRPEIDQVYARGARVGDRLCVIDSYDSVNDELVNGGRTSSHLMGCQTIRFGDERIELQEWTDWQPEILVKPIDKDTIKVQVSNIRPDGLTVQARLYPKNTAAGQAQSMKFDDQTQSYQTTFDTATTIENRWESGAEMISVTSLSGHIHIWLDDSIVQGTAEEAVHRREMVTSYSIGGRSLAFQTIGYAYAIRGYANQIKGYAPIASDDGHVMVFTPDSEQIDNGIYTIQTATHIPTIPSEATLVGQGYRLIAADESIKFDKLSINMGYLGREVPPGKEEHLIVHYLNGDQWQPLNTRVDAHQNNAVAKAPGPGLYALMVRVSIPLDREWNTISFPVQGTQPVVKALKSIADKYQILYYYDARDKENPWQIYAPDLPSWFGSLTNIVTDFEFGEVYWIYATEPVNWFVRSEEQFEGIVAGQLNVPPAVYYGKLPSGFEAGTIVTAWVGDQECGTAEAQKVQTINGPEVAFVIDVIDTFSKTSCGKPESNVTFGTGEIAKEADSATGSAIWDNSQIQEIHLTITDK